MLGRSGTGAPAMSIIPLDLQRRFERRWAARFGSLTRAVPKSIGLKALRSTRAALGKKLLQVLLHKFMALFGQLFASDGVHFIFKQQ